jgi:hypothetical protein
VNLTNKKTLNAVLIFFLILAGLEILNFGFAVSITNSTIMTVFITNTAPVVTYLNVTPDPALPGQALTFKANATDANGDPLTFTIIYYNTTGANVSGAAISLSLNGATGYYTNNTFTLSPEADAGTWSVNVTVSDGLTTIVNKTTFTVSGLLSTGLKNTPIDFGNQTVGLTAQRAENGTALAGKYKGIVAGFPLIINNTGNLQANYSINGTDLISDGGKIIGVGNVTWNVTATTDGTRTGKVALATGAPAKISDLVNAGDTQDVYFWIDTPNNVNQSQYNGTVLIETIG